MSSDLDRQSRRVRRQRNLAQRDSWGKNKSGPMKNKAKFQRKIKHLDDLEENGASLPS
jgi:hypothetical protein